MAEDRATFEYFVEIRRAEDGLGFGRRKVPEAHLEAGRQQVTFLGQRRGLASPDPTNVRVVEQPVFAPGEEGEISGVRMHVGKGRQRVERQFGIELFEPFAESVAEQLLQAQQLPPEGRVTYRAYARPVRDGRPAAAVSARVRHAALPLRSGRLDDWFEEATSVGPVHDGDHVAFVLDEVLEQARAFCWKGRGLEGGAWLVGNLYRQRKPHHEVFAVIHTVLEAVGLNRDRYQMGLSSETFLQLKAQLQRRRTCLGCVGELEMGFYHTHPFLPSELDGREACSNCSLRSQCNLTSSFLSRNDARFHAAIFGRAAYAVEMVLGLTPREGPDLRVFCLDGGRFRERGYHRLARVPAGNSSE